MAVENYNIPAQLVMADRVLSFDPDAWWYVAHETEFDKSILDFAGLFARGQIDDPELQAIAAKAGVRPGTEVPFSLRRLMGVEREIVEWAYGRMVASARAQRVTPAWIYIPMPVAGRGSPCPPGRHAQFCFGSITRPGAAPDGSDPRVAELLELAEQAGFQVVDLSGVYDGHRLESLWITAWDGHPNREGHRLVADALFSRVQADPSLVGWAENAAPAPAAPKK